MGLDWVPDMAKATLWISADKQDTFLFMTDGPYTAVQGNSFEESSLWQSQSDGREGMLRYGYYPNK